MKTNKRTAWRAFGLFAIIAFAGLAATACRSPAGQQPEPDTVRVLIPLPGVPGGRSLGLDTAREYTNYFEVFFRGAGTPPTFHSASATLAQGSIETEVPAGTYDILLFAGHRPGNGQPLLLASSYVLNRGIVLGQVNRVEMELGTFDVGLAAPASVLPSAGFTVTVDIDTRNPLITELPGSGSGIALSLSYQGGSVTLPFVSSAGNLWRYGGTVTAPATEVSASIWLDGLALTPLGHAAPLAAGIGRCHLDGALR